MRQRLNRPFDSSYTGADIDTLNGAYILSRIHQNRHDTAIHIPPDVSNMDGKLCVGSPCHSTTAKPIRPSVPMDAPVASTLACPRADQVPTLPSAFSRNVLCFSTRLTPAGKIPGNARNKPPITGPKRSATKPARTVTSPPKTNRDTYSVGLVCLSESNLNPRCITLSPQPERP